MGGGIRFQDGWCLKCGATRINVASRYEDAWYCAGVGNGDEGCGSERVFTEQDDYVNALEQAYADRFAGVAKMVRELTDAAQDGAPATERMLEHMCRLDSCGGDHAEVAIRGAIRKLLLAEREAARPSVKRGAA